MLIIILHSSTMTFATSDWREGSVADLSCPRTQRQNGEIRSTVPKSSVCFFILKKTMKSVP